MSDLYRLGLTEALSSIANGDFTVVEYVDSCIARTTAVEPQVHAFVHFDADAVRAAAGSIKLGGTLAGMPIGIKDIIATRGVPTAMGSAAFAGHVPERSAAVIDALTDASAIVFGKTVTTEFAWRHPGATRNPWNLAHTPGGSSSGSAAAVACGSVPAALGTQTLGSVLRPAAYCGVVGFKPSFGSIPRTGVYPLSESLDHIGVFTRSVVDAALLASLLAEAGPAMWPLAETKRPPRIALLRTSAWPLASAEQQRLVESVARRFESQGALVVPLELPPVFEGLWTAAQTICEVEAAIVNRRFADERPVRVGPPTLELIARGSAVSASSYDRAKALQQQLVDAFASIMAPFDAALTAPAAGEAPTGLEHTGDAVFCTPFSLLGAPAISLPAGRSNDGMPLGVQLAARRGDDRRLLEAAAWAERAIGWSQGFPLL